MWESRNIQIGYSYNSIPESQNLIPLITFEFWHSIFFFVEVYGELSRTKFMKFQLLFFQHESLADNSIIQLRLLCTSITMCTPNTTACFTWTFGWEKYSSIFPTTATVTIFVSRDAAAVDTRAGAAATRQRRSSLQT